MLISLFDNRKLHVFQGDAILRIEPKISDFVSDAGLTQFVRRLRRSSPYYFIFKAFVGVHVFLFQTFVRSDECHRALSPEPLFCYHVHGLSAGSAYGSRV
jgi:hypothetical protein